MKKTDAELLQSASDVALLAYNPDQKRDDHGRWGEGGGGGDKGGEKGGAGGAGGSMSDEELHQRLTDVVTSMSDDGYATGDEPKAYFESKSSAHDFKAMIKDDFGKGYDVKITPATTKERNGVYAINAKWTATVVRRK